MSTVRVPYRQTGGSKGGDRGYLECHGNMEGRESFLPKVILICAWRMNNTQPGEQIRNVAFWGSEKASREQERGRDIDNQLHLAGQSGRNGDPEGNNVGRSPRVKGQRPAQPSDPGV